MHRVRTWANAKAHGPAPLVRHRPDATPSLRASISRRGTLTIAEPDRRRSVAGQVQGEPALAADEGTQVKKPSALARFYACIKGILFSSFLNIALVFVPVAFAVHFASMPAGVIFAMNAIAIIPLAGLLSHATESVAGRCGDTVAALMNVTFGNAVELIIFIIALVKNEIRIVQASLVGSVLVDLLLILGMCFIWGGLRYREQVYNSTVTQMSACLLTLSVLSLILPTAFHATFKNENQADSRILPLSRGTSVILLLIYFLYLIFQLQSHSYLYAPMPRHIIEQVAAPGPAAHYFNSRRNSSSSPPRSRDHSQQAPQTRSNQDGATVERQENSRGVTTTEHSAAEGATAVTDGTLHQTQELNPASQPDNDTSAVNDARRSGQQGATEDAGPSQGRDQNSGTNEHRVGFNLASDLEAQRDTTPRTAPFLLRSLRPISAMLDNPSAAEQPEHGPQGQSIRRVQSMPTRGRRTTLGEVPAVVPIMVDSIPASPRNSEEKTETQEVPEVEAMSQKAAIILLLTSTALVALCAEFMVDSIDAIVARDADATSGISEAFIGLVLIPIVGNAAEHITSVSVALKNKMDLALGVALGSSIQIALFVTPVVVILGWIMDRDMSLYFTLFETVCMFVSTFIVNFLVRDGRSNYLEGALLASAYLIIAVAAFYLPNPRLASSVG
ncbi:Sodium/calcium exchanger protein-domain-containing protein [Sordaria brevicollis]|uniref:Sodium/calcium exchanger protein-domain-containing protein n=1 Tax=Sordaria brevicollis TaxID=83679 RepID=A0AAE0P8P5_SORBR|nr:Sodium/calcium exchanger protein-domain-containing protein [Sordaria brevicollis]